MSTTTSETNYVRIVNKSRHPFPEYATAHSVGMDNRKRSPTFVVCR